MNDLNQSEASNVSEVVVSAPVVSEPVLPVTETAPVVIETAPVLPVTETVLPVVEVAPVIETAPVTAPVEVAPVIPVLEVPAQVRKPRQPRQHVKTVKPKAEKRMGRPPVYVGKIVKYIVKLIKTHNASNARKILAARSNSKLVQYRDLELVPSPLRVSMPTLCKLAAKAGVSHKRGRPAQKAA